MRPDVSADKAAGMCAGIARLRFPPQIERQYEADRRDERVRLLVATTVVAVVLYNVFLLTDWTNLNDMFAVMVVLRTFLFTPIAFVLIWLTLRSTAAWQRELLLVTGSVLGLALPMIALTYSQTSYALSYQYGSILTMLFLFVVQRLRFRFALGAIPLMIAIQLTTTATMDQIDVPSYQAIVVFYLAAGAFLLMASYFLERADRLNFVLSLEAQGYQRELEVAATTDALTGLFNRRHLKAIAEDLAVSSNNEAPFSAILIDIDRFKLFNDTAGHLDGDECIRAIGDAIGRSLRQHGRGWAFRQGGEEFLLLLPETDPARAYRIAEDLRLAVQDLRISHPGIGPGRFVSISAGISYQFEERFSVNRLIDQADVALYRAKRQGRNRVVASERELQSVAPLAS